MARHMNGMVKLAEPTEIVDVDRMALLGGELVERACGVDEGDGTEHKGKLWLQETELLCKESCQHSITTNGDVPITNRLLLKGEWAVYPSSEMKNSNSDTGQEVKPAADRSNESEMLITLSIESEDLHNGDIPCMHLRGTSWHADHVDGLGHRMDVLRGSMDLLRAWMDTQLNVSNSAETAVVSHGEGAGTYLGTGDTKHAVYEMDGVRSHADMSTGQMDTPSIKMNVIKPGNKLETISIP